MASAVICLSKGQTFNFSKYIFDSLVRNVDSTQKVFANMRRVRKGFSGVETPLFKSMLAARDIAEEGIAEEQGAEFPTHLFQQVLDTCSALTRRVENLKHDKVAQQLEIMKLKARVKRLERANKVKSSKLRRLKKVGTSQRIESSEDMEDVFNQERMIDDLDKDKGIELVVDQVKDTDTAKTEGRHAAKQAKKQTEIYHLDLDHPSKVLSMQEDDSEVQEVVEVVTTTKLITEVVIAATSQEKRSDNQRSRRGITSKTPVETPKLKDKSKGILIETPKPMKKKDQIELDAEYARKLHKEINKDHEEINKDIDWDAAIDHVKQKSMRNQYIKRYHEIKKRPQTESEARKNMMAYLKNTDGYKLDFFKGISYDEIRPIFQARFDANMRFLFKIREEMEEEYREVLKSINETPAQKAAKRRKLNKEAQEVEDLKKHLEVVNDEDADVFTKATPLARKVPVVDYHIVLINNKPRFKIIKADETHQLYISFITLLKNFDREDQENLWGIVKERFSTSKPSNFSDEYLLTTLKIMFEKPDRQDAVWKNQSSVHGRALVKWWKLLSLCEDKHGESLPPPPSPPLPPQSRLPEYDNMAPFLDEIIRPDNEATDKLYPGCTWMTSLDFLAKMSHAKVLGKIPNSGFNLILKVLQEAFPHGEGFKIPSSYNKMKKTYKKIGLGYESIHACINDYFLFWGSKENEKMQNCPICNASRWKDLKTKGEKVSNKVVCYFSLIPRLQRLYKSQHIAKWMAWHSTGKSKENGQMNHPFDGKAWKIFDIIHSEFAKDPRNIRLGLAADGFNPFGNLSQTYSCKNHGSPLISMNTACDQVEFRRISLTGFYSCASRSQPERLKADRARIE
nr:hypothetical protein [Tanacetum cinerariifolium]